jgi:hypothetical protein
MSNFPKFGGFSISVSNEEVEASKKSSGGPRLTPGEHELEILDVEYKAPVQADNTWLRYQVILGLPGTQRGDNGKFKGAIYHSTMVPTKDIRYNDKLGVFNMLQNFFDGLGEALVPSNVGELIPAYFSDPKQLTGLKLKVTLGYKKPYVDYVDGKFVIKNKDGSLYPTSADNSFATRESAEGQAFTDNIDLQKFMEVVKVHPGVKAVKEQPKAKKQKASADW